MKHAARITIYKLVDKFLKGIVTGMTVINIGGGEFIKTEEAHLLKLICYFDLISNDKLFMGFLVLEDIGIPFVDV